MFITEITIAFLLALAALGTVRQGARLLVAGRETEQWAQMYDLDGSLATRLYWYAIGSVLMGMVLAGASGFVGVVALN